MINIQVIILKVVLKCRLSGKNKHEYEKWVQTWNQMTEEIKNLRDKIKKFKLAGRLSSDSGHLTTGF